MLLTVLSRLRQNSPVVFTHDVAQRHNLRVGRHDGVAAVIEVLKGNPLFAHVTLTRSERSLIAALVTDRREISIPQSLPGGKMASAGRNWRTDPPTQIHWTLTYLKSRHSSPSAAWRHSQVSNWY